MTGALINVTVDDAAIAKALKALAEQDGGLARACLKNIGSTVVKQVHRRFAQQVDPAGHPWAPLNPAYAGQGLSEGLNAKTALGVKRGSKILQEMGMAGGLLGSIVWQLSGDDRLEIGTNKVYGAIHQFGGRIVPRTARALVFWLGGGLVIAKAVTIPARPYLGLSTDDTAGILGVIEDHANEVWEAGG